MGIRHFPLKRGNRWDLLLTLDNSEILCIGAAHSYGVRESHQVQRHLLLSRILLSFCPMEGCGWQGHSDCREGLAWGDGWREPSAVQQGGRVHPIPSPKELTTFPFLLGNHKLKVLGSSPLAYCSIGANVLLFIFCHVRLFFSILYFILFIL